MSSGHQGSHSAGLLSTRRGPFAALQGEARALSPTRAAIVAMTRPPEEDCVLSLITLAAQPDHQVGEVRARAIALVEALRAKARRSGIEALIREYDLSSAEGIALMCLAEALLRIPDTETRDALIRDKIGHGDWISHLGRSRSLFVNAATWGLVVSGKLTATSSESGLAAALTRLVQKGGEPLVRAGVDLAMRLMGDEFVMGRTIKEALERARPMEAKGFRYSYDMLGEAALTAADARRYLEDYHTAIDAIGRVAAGRGVHEGPGISIKLSALHPRYARAQRARVLAELTPRVAELARLAKKYDIGLSIDAEEADRLDLSLDIFEALCADESLAHWEGLGFVVQAYQKRALAVIDHLAHLAGRSQRRLMVRLVKGAYWDAEIKRAQVAGLSSFPVFTRKVHTDVSYLACARKLLGARGYLYPQFATHNAQTLSAIMAMGGEPYDPSLYEFQCLHGMGEPLYEEVVGPEKWNRPCRVYAPVGAHDTLLAYLVRRLLENGANSSFVHRLADPDVPLEALVADPVEEALSVDPIGAPHPRIALPKDLYGPARKNSAGLDLADEDVLARLATSLAAKGVEPVFSSPMLDDLPAYGEPRAVLNPADHDDRVGSVVEIAPEGVAAAVARACVAGAAWSQTPPATRAAILAAAADIMEARRNELIGIMVREAGKTLPNAIGEVREAADFLRYYGAETARFDPQLHVPLGPVAAISPWNFPLAIFTGQVAAALAAGNPVLAKPAEETPLIAAKAIEILREAGVPTGALQLLPGDGTVGEALVSDPGIRGVVFTGSTAVAKRIESRLSTRLNPDGRPIPLIAETGGINAMIVDSSALPEQVVGDVVASAFDSAGQRCSALRLLCLQEEVADRVIAMLDGALSEQVLGDPVRLATDIGPVITEEARAGILDHVAAMRQRGHRVEEGPVPRECRNGTFVPPTIIEVGSVKDLEKEVFGPVLHVLRYGRDGLDALIDEINALGYGLTFGLHTRIDETIAYVTERISAGNLYVNRNMIGAVVGVQPFGGHGLSGTGPKAGGPLYLARLLAASPAPALPQEGRATPEAAKTWLAHLEAVGARLGATRTRALMESSPVGASIELPGPVGERNTYALQPRGTVLCRPQTLQGFALQVGAALASGNKVVLALPPELEAAFTLIPPALAESVARRGDVATSPCDAALFEGEGEALLAFLAQMAGREGPVVPVHALTSRELAAGRDYPLHFLVRERALSVNTAAAGGNASLMALS